MEDEALSESSIIETKGEKDTLQSVHSYISERMDEDNKFIVIRHKRLGVIFNANDYNKTFKELGIKDKDMLIYEAPQNHKNNGRNSKKNLLGIGNKKKLDDDVHSKLPLKKQKFDSNKNKMKTSKLNC